MGWNMFQNMDNGLERFGQGRRASAERVFAYEVAVTSFDEFLTVCVGMLFWPLLVFKLQASSSAPMTLPLSSNENHYIATIIAHKLHTFVRTFDYYLNKRPQHAQCSHRQLQPSPSLDAWA
jgi:hypothetical protein